MRFGYEMDNITIYAFGTNILNEKVMTSRNFANINRSSGEISLANGGTNTSILPPRAFGIGIDYSF
jgi:outer membrane receptor protein involved in Fe transport